LNGTRLQSSDDSVILHACPLVDAQRARWRPPLQQRGDERLGVEPHAQQGSGEKTLAIVW